MLFYASERYPKEDEYSKFIRQVTAVSWPIRQWPLPEGVESPLFLSICAHHVASLLPCSPLNSSSLYLSGAVITAAPPMPGLLQRTPTTSSPLTRTIWRRLWTAFHRSGEGRVQLGVSAVLQEGAWRSSWAIPRQSSLGTTLYLSPLFSAVPLAQISHPLPFSLLRPAVLRVPANLRGRRGARGERR